MPQMFDPDSSGKTCITHSWGLPNVNSEIFLSHHITISSVWWGLLLLAVSCKQPPPCLGGTDPFCSLWGGRDSPSNHSNTAVSNNAQCQWPPVSVPESLIWGLLPFRALADACKQQRAGVERPQFQAAPCTSTPAWSSAGCVPAAAAATQMPSAAPSPVAGELAAGDGFPASYVANQSSVRVGRPASPVCSSPHQAGHGGKGSFHSTALRWGFIL